MKFNEIFIRSGRRPWPAARGKVEGRRGGRRGTKQI